MNYFYFLFFLALIFIASLQDLKRREVDNWLNLFIFFCGFIFVFINAIFYKEISYLTNLAFASFFIFLFVNFLYISKIFSGGDCKLLFSLTPLFVSVDFLRTFLNSFYFICILSITSAFYGLIWILFLFFSNFNETKKEFFVVFKKNFYFLLLSLIFLVFSIFFKESFLFFLLIFFLLIFYFLSLSLNKTVLIKEVFTKDLREGDWLEKDLKIKGRTIKSSFEGLSLKDIEFIKKNLKKVRIKDGIPLAPAFFFAFIVFYFFDFYLFYNFFL